ncbi:alpha-(1,3)-fucosyltransferase C-like [Epargyreus clarus]|uniref:alpha-(1,3)-fucosyltransferase C-like n=1 Tax=Epargyreus clarus TaxID=520877 RepID=UPI003C2D01D7
MSDKCITECTNVFIKLFLAIFVIYGLSLMYVYNSRLQEIRAARKEVPYVIHQKIKYILQWTRRFSAPFDFMGSGNSAFVKQKCKYTNCFVTDDANYFLDQTEFDAIAFNGRDVIHLWPFQMPAHRSPKQKYIFGAMESADNFPACDESLDNFFNWTWTYRLDSDFRWGYITIYDIEGNVVGPAVDMKWPEEMKPVTNYLKKKLSRKSKAAAWFVSHCKTKRQREDFVDEVSKELEQYGHKIDIYGSCGEFSCPRSNSDYCFKKVESDYYFYFSLENSFSEDYVTEKLLTALNNYAVPVVFGFANYSRFLPPGSYLDARELGAKNLARVMSDVIANKTRYYDFFRWRNHFSYNETSDNADVCKLCEVLNDDQMVNTVSVWQNFREWWNGAQYKENCP